MHELIAPRPLRAAASYGLPHQRKLSAKLQILPSPSPPINDALSRMRLADADASTCADHGDAAEPVLDRTGSTSPFVDAPRFLQSEALEEFLSILRPNVFLAPSSPIARYPRHSHRHTASAQLAITGPSPSPSGYERPAPYKRAASRAASSASRASDDAESLSKRNNPSRSGSSLHASAADERDSWQASLLSSPISRSHTMNPLPRDPVYEHLTQNLVFRLSSRTPSPSLLLSASMETSDAHMEPLC